MAPTTTTGDREATAEPQLRFAVQFHVGVVALLEALALLFTISTITSTCKQQRLGLKQKWSSDWLDLGIPTLLLLHICTDTASHAPPHRDIGSTDYYRWGTFSEAVQRRRMNVPQQSQSHCFLPFPHISPSELKYSAPSPQTVSTYYSLYQSCTHSTLYSDHVRNAAKGVCTGVYVRTYEGGG